MPMSTAGEPPLNVLPGTSVSGLPMEVTNASRLLPLAASPTIFPVSLTPRAMLHGWLLAEPGAPRDRVLARASVRVAHHEAVAVDGERHAQDAARERPQIRERPRMVEKAMSAPARGRGRPDD